MPALLPHIVLHSLVTSSLNWVAVNCKAYWWSPMWAFIISSMFDEHLGVQLSVDVKFTFSHWVVVHLIITVLMSLLLCIIYSYRWADDQHQPIITWPIIGGKIANVPSNDLLPAINLPLYSSLSVPVFASLLVQVISVMNVVQKHYQLNFGYCWWSEVTSLQDLDPSLCWLPHSCLSWVSWDGKDDSNQGSLYIDWWGATYNINEQTTASVFLFLKGTQSSAMYVNGTNVFFLEKATTFAFCSRWSSTLKKCVCTWHQWSYCQLVQWLQNSKPPQRLPHT